jgi:hypothetical protein
MAALAFVILFPAGAISIRLMSFPGLVWFHAAFQALAYLVYIVAFGMGVWLATNMGYVSPSGIAQFPEQLLTAISFRSITQSSASSSSFCSSSNLSLDSSTTRATRNISVGQSGRMATYGTAGSLSRSVSLTVVLDSCLLITPSLGRSHMVSLRALCG